MRVLVRFAKVSRAVNPTPKDGEARQSPTMLWKPRNIWLRPEQHRHASIDAIDLAL
jgi:hypothetical protein